MDFDSSLLDSGLDSDLRCPDSHIMDFDSSLLDSDLDSDLRCPDSHITGTDVPLPHFISMSAYRKGPLL